MHQFVTSPPSNLNGVDGASFCKRLTSQAENVARGVGVPVVNPFRSRYCETFNPFGPPMHPQAEQV